ncbi:MAG: MMPL family transporter [Planctomycetia bacterium]|nr:MMPL family transporter [Planctomycetia bacterium]
MKMSFYSRFGLPIIVIVAIVFPITVWGAVLALQSNKNDVKEWLPESFKETQDYHEFEKHFGNDTFVLASWDGCTLDDTRLDKLAQFLSPSSDLPGSRFFTKVMTGRSLFQQLSQAPTGLPPDEISKRLAGSFVGPDGQQTCAVLTLSVEGKENLRETVETIYTTAAEKCGISRSSIRLGGPPVDNVAIDVEGERMLLTLMNLSGIVGLGLAWWYLRNVRLTAMVFVGGVYSAAISLALVYAVGGHINSVLLTMPSVVYTAGLSAAIHIVNYYRHTRAQHGLVGAAERGVVAAWIPCSLSAGTTSLGLISLYTSQLVPIKNFGLYTSIGVMTTVVFMFLYLPSALQLWPPAMLEDEAGQIVSPLDPGHRRRMRGVGQKVIARPLWIWAVFMVLMLVCGSGLHRVKTTVNLMSLFSSDAEIIHSYRWLEQKLGPLVPMEVVVQMDTRQTQLTFLDRMELVGRMQRAIESIRDAGGTMSAATFSPDLSTPKRSSRGVKGVLFNEKTYRTVLNRRLEAHRDDYVQGDYLADAPDGQELWRISLRVAALADIDYGEFIKGIENHVAPLIERERQNGVRGIAGVTYTGLTPVVYKAERELLSGLIDSFFWAFVMIAAVMTVVFRDLRAGLYTMLPNVWPVAIVFGVLSWFEIALDIGTMMTASVAMGVCVDDTVHFANWFRRATRMGLGRRDAVVLAFENSAGAIYQSTVIVALGLVTFALSSFMPTRRFGLLMCTLLAFGLVADLVLTPAMLAGAVGRFFTKGCGPSRRLKPDILADSDDESAAQLGDYAAESGQRWI